MKRTLFIAILSLAAACGSKKTEGGDKAGDKMAGDKMAGDKMAKPPAGSAAAMAGSAATPTMAGSAATMAAGSATAMAGSAAAKDEALPAVADYEDKAKTDITDKNAADQLTDLEKDLPQ